MIYTSSLVPKLIYVFRINDDAHKGCLKVGDATADDGLLAELGKPNSMALQTAAKKRINQYTQTAGINYELLYTELAVGVKDKRFFGFRDSDVHNVLRHSGIEKKDFDTEAKADEWFVTDLGTVQKAIEAVKSGRESLNASEITKNQSPVEFRPEQRAAIDRTIKQFRKSNQMLWNAKMRFGKTLSALQVVKEMNFVRTLILTHRPVVNAGWFEDFKKIFYDRDDFFKFGSKQRGNSFDLLERNAKKEPDSKYIYFASMQDLRGSEKVGGSFDKNNEIFKTEWDLIIVDEAHEGTTTELGRNVIAELLKDDTKILRLSGTPFNLLDDFNENEIYTWDYVMEQTAKRDWDKVHKGDPNPYAGLPKLNIFTFSLGSLIGNFADDDQAFNFHEFFRVDDAENFVHEKEVQSFLNLICKKDSDSNYPYSTEEYRDNFRHSLWVVPGVKEARALSALLKRHKVFSAFEVVNVAGEGDEDEECKDALEMVQKAIGKHPEDTYTITLSCGRLTTGVSVPEWTAVFMLSGSSSTSAASYMQTIFRVQTPATINGMIKEDCFVFDFAPDRTLKVLAETAKISAKAGRTSQNDRKIMGEFLNFCPVIAFDGTRMKTYDVEKMLGQLKRVQVERVVRHGFEDNSLYNDNLLKLDKIELEKFNDLKKIIGSTKAMKKSGDIDINKTGLTDEEYEDQGNNDGPKTPQTKEDLDRREKLKEVRKQRDAAASILRGISIRMPLLIYGADLKSEKEEISIDNFANLVDDSSWEEFMPKGVTKELFEDFKKYYEEDIFREAGKRIREMARAADNLTIEDRINRLGNIFNSFRNPDKETVLTPWRVVNMHLGDALGGYVFFNENYESERMLEQPRYVNNGSVTKNVFDPDSRILEINSKSGLYPLYMAYGIYRARLRKELGTMTCTTIAKQQAFWDKVIAENIFVVCKTPMAVSITKRTLMGFRKGKVNAKSFENLIDTIVKEPDAFIKTIRQGRTFWKANEDNDMKFNAVVGNPPYQLTKDGTSDNPIYHLFMDVSFKISEIVSLITPGRFLFNAGKTPTEWNAKVLNDEHFKVVWYKTKSTDVFPNVDIKGGVAVTFRNAKEKFGKIITYTAFPELNEILKKVISAKGFLSIDCAIYSQNKFDLTKLYHDYPNYKKLVGSEGREKRLTTSIFELLDVFTEKKINATSLKILGLIKNNRVYRYIPSRYIETHENLMKYKVMLPKSNGSGAIGEVLSTPLVGEPLVGYTQSFISIGSYESGTEANAALKYIKTKFARAMLGVLKVTQDNSRDVWKYVPLQDFTSKSDIDWTKSVTTIDIAAQKKYGLSINEIDAQLYAKYGLTKEEITFIETHVKAMG